MPEMDAVALRVAELDRLYRVWDMAWLTYYESLVRCGMDCPRTEYLRRRCREARRAYDRARNGRARR